MASHIAAAGFEMDALAFLSYPLHPPGKPERLRDEHLTSIRQPMLFIQGTRDPFAKPDLLASTVDRLKSARLVQVDGGDHSLRVRGRKPADVYEEVVNAIAVFADSM
jgi:predicted alpha/beta-hydrolase family hydrolase